MKTEAAILREAGGPLSIEEVTLGEPTGEEVLVRVEVASACHSDVHVMNLGGPHLPLALGHEAAGTVEAVGSEVVGLSPGDLVAFSFVPSCGRCRMCVRGIEVACERGSGIGGDGRPLEGTYRMRTADGLDVGQMVRLGTFARHIVVHQDSLQALPEGTDLRVAALLSCGFVTGAGSAMNVAGVRPGESVLVAGLGGVGIAAIQGAVVAGAADVIAVDVREEKLALAKEFGATHAVDARSPGWVEQVRSLTGGLGADKALSCVGTVTDEHLKEFIACVRVAGHAVVVGAGRPTLELMDLGRRTLTWTLYGSERPKADLLRFLALHDAGRFRIEEMITRSYTFDELNDCLADVRKGDLIRGIIEFTER
jgi:Zn-dependent alcohol dehydrogenase